MCFSKCKTTFYTYIAEVVLKRMSPACNTACLLRRHKREKTQVLKNETESRPLLLCPQRNRENIQYLVALHRREWGMTWKYSMWFKLLVCVYHWSNLSASSSSFRTETVRYITKVILHKKLMTVPFFPTWWGSSAWNTITILSVENKWSIIYSVHGHGAY